MVPARQRASSTKVTGFAAGGDRSVRIFGTIGEGWRFDANVVFAGGAVVVRSLMIAPVGGLPTGGITASVLQAFSIQAVRATVEDPTPPVEQTSFEEWVEAGGPGITPAEAEATMRQHIRLSLGVPHDDEGFEFVRRPGPKGRSPRELASWLRRYLAARETDPRRPNEVLAQRHGITPKQAGNIVARLRQLGYISRSGGQGRSGGLVTERGDALLKSTSRPKR